MSDYRGRFLWFELLTSDPAKASAFYTTVVGWGTDTWPGMPVPYQVWTRAGVPVGGLLKLPAEAQGRPSHWLAYIGSANVDRTVAEAQAIGGKLVVAASDIPSVGRFAVLADPGGVTFAVYTPQADPGPDSAPTLGDCSWHEIVADDPPRSWSFFSSLFGWEKKGEAHDMGPMGIYQEYGRSADPRPLGGIYPKPVDRPGPPHLMLYFRVADVARSAELVTANGGQVIHGPAEVPGGDVILTGLDPQGAAFSLHHTAKA